MSNIKIKLNYIATIFFVIILINTLLFSYKLNAYADNNKNIDYITIEECKIAAQKWIKQNYNNETIIDEIIPILSMDKIESYCINFKKNDTPKGYLILDANKYAVNYIKEFSLSGNGIYQTLIKNAGITTNEAERVIYSLGGYNYAIPINFSGSSLYSTSNTFLSKQDLNLFYDTTNYVNYPIDTRSDAEKKEYYDGFFSFSEIPTIRDCFCYTIKGAHKFIPSTMDELVTLGGYSGNCSPTASTNLLSYYCEQRNFTNLGTSRKNIYNNFVKASGWNEFGNQGQSSADAIKGMKTVVENAGYKYKSDTYMFNYWTDWTRDIDKDYPVFTSLRGLKETNGTWEEVGHAVIAIGYREYVDGYKYLRIYDGWNDTSDKFIWFNSDYFKSIKGTRIEVNSQ